MKKFLFLSLTIMCTCLIWVGCSNSVATNNNVNTSWVFVANEGNFGASNGSVSMIDDKGNVYETDPIGDVVQSLEVYGNKLIVLINNSHKIKIYDITSEGLSMPGIEVQAAASPREMVVFDGFVYFTNWGTNDVQRLNLTTYAVDLFIPVGVMPEGIIRDGNTLWVANSGENTVSEINILTSSVITHIVGSGPQNLVKYDGKVYISRTFYDDNWNAYHGATRIDGLDILVNDYGSGAACGGSVLHHSARVYRSFDGGLARMDEDLNLELVSIGNFDQSQVYHVENIKGNFWFTITDYSYLNEVHVLNSDGTTLKVYEVGINPGDLAYWTKSE